VLRFHLNGQPVEVDASPTTTLLDYLRHTRRLTGTKEGCDEGDCGACTVAMLDPHAHGGPRWRAVNSCLVMLGMVDGHQLVTVEGLAQGDRLHPAQAAMVDRLGSQCGYCTPGVVMSLFEATYRTDLDDLAKRDDQLCGNLCRCTGYRPIRAALDDVAGQRPEDPFLGALANAEALAPVHHEAEGARFDAPTTATALVALLAEHPQARIVCGATDLGLTLTKRKGTLPHLISVSRVPELAALSTADGVHTLGATVTLTDLEAWAQTALPILARTLRFFGSRQIKHRATLGGNLCNASPIGDLPPVLLALDATLVLLGPEGERTLPIDQFFLDYRKTALRGGEIVKAIRVRSPASGAHVGSYKVSRRRELDISAVCMAAVVTTDAQGVVDHVRVAYGGMAAIPTRVAAVEHALLGQPWTEHSVAAAAAQLPEALTPIGDHRGSAWYRATVAQNLLLGFFHETATAPSAALPDRPTSTLQGAP
jgi:xanthine dehydrogenase small subunit